ncbi:MAG TPA: stage II sporulation protein M [Deinococcales bacterium]|nr:stage II sporulation protein M [Deinococcales bacterium]
MSFPRVLLLPAVLLACAFPPAAAAKAPAPAALTTTGVPAPATLSGPPAPVTLGVLAAPVTLGVLPAGTADPAAPSTAKPAVNAPADAKADAQADDAVRNWLVGRYSVDLSNANQDPLNVARRMLLFTPSPNGAVVSWNLREVVKATPEQRVYRYPITSRDTGDFSIDVTLNRAASGAWTVASIMLAGTGSSIPSWVSGPSGVWIFLAVTAALIFGTLSARSAWRGWVVSSVRDALVNRRLFVITNVVLYGAFIVGLIVGATNPRLVQLLQELVTNTLQQGGITDAVSGNVGSAAFSIAYFNFSNGTVLTTFLPGLVFAGFPYLINFSRFLVLGAALTPSTVPLVAWLLHVPVMIVELQAYIFVTAAAGIMLSRLYRGGFRVFTASFVMFLRSLSVASILLVAAAWYEAFEVLKLIPWILGR